MSGIENEIENRVIRRKLEEDEDAVDGQQLFPLFLAPKALQKMLQRCSQ